MTSDKERYEQKESIHMYLALQRKKDNPGQIGKKIFRQLIYDEEKDIEIIKLKCKQAGGVWRILHTVNARDCRKALKKFRHTIIDTDKTSITSLWRKELLQPENKATRNYMLDVDTEDIVKLNQVINIIPCDNFALPEHIGSKSPNGYRIVIRKMDTRLFEEFDYVTVIKDGYYHVCVVGEIK